MEKKRTSVRNKCMKIIVKIIIVDERIMEPMTIITILSIYGIGVTVMLVSRQSRSRLKIHKQNKQNKQKSSRPKDHRVYPSETVDMSHRKPSKIGSYRSKGLAPPMPTYLNEVPDTNLTLPKHHHDYIQVGH